MKKNWISKAMIFVVGMAAGGVVSAIVTRQVVDKTYRDAADEEIHEATKLCNEKIKGYKEEIKQLKEKIARQKVTINTLADQVREGGNGEKLDDILAEDEDAEDDPRLRAAVTKVTKEDQRSEKSEYKRYSQRYVSGGGSGRYEEPDDVEYPDIVPAEIEDSIRENSPREISEDAFSTGAMSYSKESLTYYLYDGMVISEDEEWIDNYERLTGKFEIGNAGDVIYIRNDELAVDYQITFVAGFGGQAINRTNIWDGD